MHAPLKISFRKQRRLLQKPLITIGILVSIKNKQMLHETYFLSCNKFEKTFFKIINKLIRIKNLLKKMFYNNVI